MHRVYETPLIHFCGIVFGRLGDDDGRGPCVLVCSASRKGKVVKPLLLKLNLAGSRSYYYDMLRCGDIVSGRAEFQGHANGILMSSKVEDVSTDYTLSAVPFETTKISRRFPFFAMPVLQECGRLCREFLNIFLPWQWLPVKISCGEFSRLLQARLAQPQSSLTHVSFNAMAVKRIRHTSAEILEQNRREMREDAWDCLIWHESGKIYRDFRRPDELEWKKEGYFGEWEHKFLCLVPAHGKDAELPLLVTCEVPGVTLETGQMFEGSFFPLLQVSPEDGVSLLECGKSDVSLEDIMPPARYPGLLESACDGLLDMMHGRKFWWPAVFPRLTQEDTLPAVLKMARERLEGLAVPLKPRVHGWWGSRWFFFDRLETEDTGIPGVSILVSKFRFNCSSPRDIEKPLTKWRRMRTVGDWIQYYFSELPPRAIVMPADAESLSFPARGCSVSLCENPEILEGPFRPDGETWELVQGWIRRNLADLCRK